MSTDDLALAVSHASYDVTTLVDQRGVVRWMSGGMEDLTGHRAEAVIGRPIIDLVCGGDRERAALAFARLVSDVNMSRLVVGIDHADGSKVLVEVTGANRLDDERVNGYIIHLRRAHGTIVMVDRSATMEHLLHVVLEHAGEGVLACDQHGLIELCNRKMAELLGWDLSVGMPAVWPDRVLLRTLDGVLVEPTQLPHLRGLQGESIEQDYLLDGPKGRRRLRAKAVPVPGGAGADEVGGSLAIFLDVTDQTAYEASLLHRATHDALTGLLSRASLLDELSAALRRWGARQRLGALLFIDIDHLKMVNDTMGHAAGDVVLGEVACRLRVDRTPDDVVARFAGDEFIVFAPVESVAGANALAHTIVQRLRQPLVIDNRTLYPTASVGVAVGGTDVDGSMLLRSADLAANRAKQHGRNRWEFGDADRLSSSQQQLEGFGWIRRAIDDRRFDSVIQPIFGRDGRLAGGEMLARGYDLDGRMIPPDEFIPLAVKGGLVDVIDRTSLDRAIELVRDLGLKAPMRISCNISAEYLNTVDFAAGIVAAVDASGIDPRCLALELTERSFIETTPEIDAALLRLVHHGVALGIDDFGTMYSTIGLLRKLPFTFLKIDRSFVEWAPRSGRDSTLVRCIIDIAHSRGITVIAEGVENEEQRSFLLDVGCDFLQGMLLSPPIPVDQFVLPDARPTSA